MRGVEDGKKKLKFLIKFLIKINEKFQLFFAVLNSPAMQAAPGPDPSAAPLRRRLNHRQVDQKAAEGCGGGVSRLGRA